MSVTHLWHSSVKSPTQQPVCPPVWNLDTNSVMLGTVMPASVDVRLNPDSKG